MTVSGIANYLSMYSHQQCGTTAEVSHKQDASWESAQHKNAVAASATNSSSDKTSYSNKTTSSLVSASVQKTLLAYQETGTVFEEDTRLQMFRRGVTEEEMTRFSEIINDAANKGAYADPMKYINSLSDSDIEVIRHVHCLAETDGVTGTQTQEGAINLLLPPQNAVDIDNNGMVNRGQATLFQFPPPNAPQAVKDAWEGMTEGMSLEERMMAEFPFLVQSILSNLKEDANGNVIGIYEPTEEGYTNIFGTTEDSWNDLLDHMRMYQEGLSEYDPVGAAKNIEMIDRFAEALLAQMALTTPSTNQDARSADESSRKVEVINGKSVIVAGHNLDAREGISLLRTVNMSMSDFNPDSWADDQQAAAGTHIVKVEGGLTEVSREALGPLPPGATGTYMNIDRMRPAGTWLEDPMKVPIDEEQSYYRRTTQALMDVVEVERELKAKYGDDIKLIYSHTEESYVMLTKDDARYDEMASAESSVQKIITDVHRGFIDRESVEDILNQHGFTV